MMECVEGNTSASLGGCRLGNEDVVEVVARGRFGELIVIGVESCECSSIVKASVVV